MSATGSVRSAAAETVPSVMVTSMQPVRVLMPSSVYASPGTAGLHTAPATDDGGLGSRLHVVSSRSAMGSSLYMLGLTYLRQAARTGSLRSRRAPSHRTARSRFADNSAGCSPPSE